MHAPVPEKEVIMLRSTCIIATLSLILGGLCACGAAQSAGPNRPVGSSKVELRLIAANEAEGEKVPTWDGKVTMVVDRKVHLTDADFSEVSLGKMPDGAPAISIQLDQTASLTLEDLTAKHRGRRMAVLVGGKIVIAPTIKERIEGGKMSIVGQSPAETEAIYKHIKSP
jgi:preprotein translocase subunit SecD